MEIKRLEQNEEWAHTGVVEAGKLVFVSYCMKNEGRPIEDQMHGAFDVLSERLDSVGLSLSSVVQMDCLFRDIADLMFLADVIKQRFPNAYPARKAYETKFIREGIRFQVKLRRLSHLFPSCFWSSQQRRSGQASIVPMRWRLG